MPHRVRIHCPGAVYHVLSGRDQRDDTSLDDVDRYDLLKTVAEACQKTGWQVHAFGMTGNHHHQV